METARQTTGKIGTIQSATFVASTQELISNHQRFEQLVKECPVRLTQYWNFDNGSCDIDRLEHDIALLQGEERIMAEFFHCIWTDQMPFGPVESMYQLSEKSRNVIRRWSEYPFFL